MNKLWWSTYGVTAGVMLVLDAAWLGGVASSLYAQMIGHLMAEQPRLGIAAMFYLLYPVGLVVFVAMPQAGRPGLVGAVKLGALFGLMAYGTYDLTNLATLKGWPVSLALLDMAWGATVSAASAGRRQVVAGPSGGQGLTAGPLWAARPAACLCRRSNKTRGAPPPVTRQFAATGPHQRNRSLTADSFRPVHPESGRRRRWSAQA